MINVELKEGQDAWIFTRGHKGEMTKGKVVKVTRLDGYDYDHYIIAFATGIDDVFEVREGNSVSDAADKPIGLWRR